MVSTVTMEFNRRKKFSDLKHNNMVWLLTPKKKTARASILTHHFPSMFNVVLVRNPTLKYKAVERANAGLKVPECNSYTMCLCCVTIETRLS